VRDAAFIAVYREHVRFVWRLCRSFGVCASHVDDVVHDVFLVLRRRLPDRPGDAPLLGWIAGITRNVVMHHHRAGARRDARLRAVDWAPTGSSPDQELGQREAAALLQSFLDGLEPRKREVFVLMEIEGLSAPETATVVDAKIATVYTRLRAARREFASFLATLEDGEEVGHA
jgi:RNA polymerase sigma-70 factor (ECF subfamily)